jgi:hypothetical protein
MSSDTTFVRRRDVLATVIDDEVVMMDVHQGQYFNIKGVGVRIWELLECPRTLDAIVAEVRREYDVDEQPCCSDVSEFLAALEGMGLISRS